MGPRSTAALGTTLRPGWGGDAVNGGPGDDTFRAYNISGGTPTGADVYNGGDGLDTLDDTGDVNGVTISLDGAANDGEVGEHDNVGSDIERIIGSLGNDTITGDTSDNTLVGGGGNDALNGGGGSDSLLGEYGDDTLSGGEGNDTLDGGMLTNVLNGGEGDDLLRDTPTLSAPGTTNNTLNGGGGTDTADYDVELGIGLPGETVKTVNVSLDGLANGDASGRTTMWGPPAMRDASAVASTTRWLATQARICCTAVRARTHWPARNAERTRSISRIARMIWFWSWMAPALQQPADDGSGNTIATDSWERLQGGAGSDVIVGNGTANYLDGGARVATCSTVAPAQMSSSADLDGTRPPTRSAPAA